MSRRCLGSLLALLAHLSGDDVVDLRDLRLSGIHADLPEQAIDAIAARHPLGLGSADDLVGAYAYLASEASSWTTGSAVVVDGGYSAP